MRSVRSGLALIAVTLLLGLPMLVAANDESDSNWPALGGADGRRISQETGLLTSWNQEEHVRWKTAIPGRGHSSPIVWGDRIFLTTAIQGEEVPGRKPLVHYFEGEEWRHPDSWGSQFVHEYRVVAIDADSGEIVWNRLAHTGLPYDDRARRGSYASPTAVTDGQTVYAYFGVPGVFAYDFDGNELWHAEIGPVVEFGLDVSTSPVLYENRLIVLADEDSGDHSFIVALDTHTGEVAWKKPRRVQSNWSTPLLIDRSDQPQLVTNGFEWIISYDPRTGEELWRIPGLQSNAVHYPLLHDDLALFTAGYPDKVLKAVRLDDVAGGTDAERVAWSYNKGMAYVPSNLSYRGYVYLLSDNGIVSCLDANTGEVIYEGGRMPVAQRFWASPVAFEGKFMLAGTDGEVFVIKAGPEFEVLATNTLGEPIFATPAISNGRMYFRTEHNLWAIGPAD